MKYLLWAGLLGSAGVAGVIHFAGPAPTMPADRPAAPDSPVAQGVGYVEPRGESRRLSVKATGLIEALPAERGRRYRRGDLLAALRDGEERAAVAVAEREVEHAKAELALLLAGPHPERLRTAETEVTRLQDAVRVSRSRYQRVTNGAGRGAVSSDDVETAEYALRRDEGTLRAAEAELAHLRKFVRAEDRAVGEARVRAAAARLELARRRLEDTRLTAPFDGEVLEVFRREGEGVYTMDPGPVLLFADTARLWVRVEVDERFAARLRESQRAVVFGRGLGGKEFEGRVASLKRVMGKKRLFAGSADERRDLDVLEAFVDLGDQFQAPVALRVDVKLFLAE